jgi:cystathionine beta-lyase family protein involved in aluminum resistance
MQVNREFSPEVAKVLQNIDEKVLKNLLQDKKSFKKQKNQISKQQLKNAFGYLRKSNPFRDVEDPVEWQKKQREDRD